jgi:hypothetical protein
MSYTRTIPFLFLYALLLLASSALAQTGDWQTLQALPSGTKVKVTLKNAPTFGHCFLDGVSDNQLVCSTRMGLRSRRRAYLRDDIKAVYLAHSGPAIGFAVGAGAGAALGATRNPVPGLGRGGTALVDAGLLGGLGAFLGQIADPFFYGRAVYLSPQDPPHSPRKNRNSPSVSNGRSTIPPADNVPCLKDGKTLKCVDP